MPAATDFDTIVVGGGAAGCILAARLSENPGRRVALIEAGADTPPGALPDDIRDTYPVSYSNPAYFWDGLAASAREGAPAAPFPQARVMGGGSSVMGMWALRGQPDDYEAWVAAGAEGWGWTNVLPAFERLERDLDFGGPMHGRDGPIPIRRHFPEAWPEFAKALASAAARDGLPLHTDINGDFTDGVYPVPLTNDAAGRATSASAYLTADARRRPNLAIESGATVERILFEGLAASGISVRRAGRTERLRAREIVLAAGAIGSPALLLRSGIGPADELRRAGVEPLHDLPGVGRNLQNHCIVNLVTRISPGARQSAALRTYGLACARASSGHPLGRTGDLHLQFIAKTSPNAHGDRLGIVGAALYAPLSRGRVTLRSPDPALAPNVEFRILSEAADRERLAIAVGRALTLLDDPAVRRLHDEVFAITPSSLVRKLNRPGAAYRLAAAGLALLLDAPAPLRRAVLGQAGTVLPRQDDLSQNKAEGLLAHASAIFHPAGTCAIGRRDDPNAVLDPRCAVRGVGGLFVADASVMPVIPTANTCLPTMMIAERAAELMR